MLFSTDTTTAATTPVLPRAPVALYTSTVEKSSSAQGPTMLFSTDSTRTTTPVRPRAPAACSALVYFSTFLVLPRAPLTVLWQCSVLCLTTLQPGSLPLYSTAVLPQAPASVALQWSAACRTQSDQQGSCRAVADQIMMGVVVEAAAAVEGKPTGKPWVGAGTAPRCTWASAPHCA